MGNANQMKLRNQRSIIKLLRQQPVSRAELARKTGLTRAAISVLIDTLLGDGIVTEDQLVTGKIGRTSVTIKLNPEKYRILAINIARDICTVGLCDFSGEILRVEKFLQKEGVSANHMLCSLSQKAMEFLKEEECVDRLLGIGITAPGPLDSMQGTILKPSNFEAWHQTEVVSYFQERFPCPVYIENNAQALAMAERYCGAGIREESFLELIVDTGVGGGLILNGKPYKGIHGYCGEIGHTTVNLDGARCSCGNHGCLELYASIPNVLRGAMEINKSYTSWEKIMDSYEAGETEAVSVVERECRLLAASLTTMMNLLDVGVVFVSGELLYKGDLIYPCMEQLIKEQMIGLRGRSIRICPSGLPKESAMIAGANLVLEKYAAGTFSHNITENLL